MYGKFANIVVAALGSMGSYLFGGWSALLEFLVLLVVVDYITGIVASIKEGRSSNKNKGLSSKKGSIGLAKKGLMFLVIIVMHRADIVFELSFLMTGSIYFYLANELISIIENLGRANCPLPPQLKQVVEILKRKEIKDDTNEVNK
ncbi:phage holin family protein [Paenibacillus sp. N1-5-1-14]|uniref:phage holin family protein n=1 Tax=Paenibacillus radicibacter TaxID=2972488 RepID=UPI00215999AF|nr:phage holin family protein [Paenibacillus radicibacter]MCR8641571.1 phage holin family protein [Paenibacillus radicibacter]